MNRRNRSNEDARVAPAARDFAPHCCLTNDAPDGRSQVVGFCASKQNRAQPNLALADDNWMEIRE